MVTVFEADKCVCIWGDAAYADPTMVSSYKARGYTIVRLANGTGNVRECFKEIVRSNSTP